MNYWNEKLIIANKSYPRFLGGPLDGYTDSPWRRLVREFSPENLLYSEMRHVSCVAHETGGARALDFEQDERPLNFQITINEKSRPFLDAVLDRVEGAGVDMIDVNIACPARNVVKSESGSALMANLSFVEELLEYLVSRASVPVTVKMRAGFKEKNALDVMKVVEQCGVSAIALHPRLQSAKFSGEPDYSLVAEGKAFLSIPLLYSGGIHTFADAEDVRVRTGVDGFLIGRGMFGAPWKLAELEAYARGDSYHVSFEEKIETAIKHLQLSFDYYGEDGVYAFRKHLASYVGDFENATRIRDRLMQIDSKEELVKELRICVGMKRA